MRLMKMLMNPLGKIKNFDSRKALALIWGYTGFSALKMGGIFSLMFLTEDETRKFYLAVLGLVAWIILFTVYKILERFLEKKKEKENLQN